MICILPLDSFSFFCQVNFNRKTVVFFILHIITWIQCHILWETHGILKSDQMPCEAKNVHTKDGHMEEILRAGGIKPWIILVIKHCSRTDEHTVSRLAEPDAQCSQKRHGLMSDGCCCLLQHADTCHVALYAQAGCSLLCLLITLMFNRLLVL